MGAGVSGGRVAPLGHPFGRMAPPGRRAREKGSTALQQELWRLPGLRTFPESRVLGARPILWVIQGGTMRRMTIGALLTAALLSGPAVVTAEAQAPVAAQAAAVQATQSQAQDDDNKDDDDGGWGLWGLAGLLGLLGLIPRRRKTHDTGTRRGTGTGGAHPNDRL
ncbi:WGxxGxxG family protein [Streptomyces pseudogriseolus]|uniref:WGxxGxxG family protein n=1 Tax=Streptomyces pseudogriseolus TaxID=36817 RepID=UPI003FA264DB